MKTKMLAATLFGIVCTGNAWAENACSYLAGTWESIKPNGYYEKAGDYEIKYGWYEKIKISVNGEQASFDYFSRSNDSGFKPFTGGGEIACNKEGANSYVLVFPFKNGITATHRIQVTNDGKSWSGVWTNSADGSSDKHDSNYNRVTPVPSISQTTSNRNSSGNSTSSGGTPYSNSNSNGTPYGNATVGGRAESDNSGATSANHSQDEESKNMSSCINLLEVSGQYALQNRCDVKVAVSYCTDGQFAKSSNNYAVRCGAGTYQSAIGQKSYGQGGTTVEPGSQNMIAATSPARLKLYACEYPKTPYLVSYNPPKGMCGK